MMKEVKELLKNYDKPLTKEQLEKIIYNIFCIIIFFIPVIPEVYGFGIYSLKSTIFNFSTIITAIVLLIINIKDMRIKNINWYDILLMLYLLLVIMSTIFTNFDIEKCILGENGRGEGTLTIISYVMTFIIFSRGYKYMARVSKVAILAAVIVSIYGILQANIPVSIQLPFDSSRLEGIATGTMGNQNFLSSYICIFLPMMCLYYINDNKNMHTSLIVIIPLFLALVFSSTLSGYITFIFMYIVLAIFSVIFSKMKKNTIIRITVLTLIIICIFIGLKYLKGSKYSAELISSGKEVTNLIKKDDSFGTHRMEVWKKSLMVISEYPLLGVGPDSMDNELKGDKYETNEDSELLKSGRIDKAHSEPLQIAATTGIPSAIIYLILAVVVSLKLLILEIKTLIKNGINQETLFIGMVLISLLSYLMQSMVNISVVQVAPVFWAVFGTAAGITSKKISTL